MSDFAIARQKMVDGQIRPSDVTDLRIIEAMLEVAREQFVPANLRPVAYLDLDIDVGSTTAKSYLIKPVTLAKMLQAAAIEAGDKVLVVGCATGYAAAVISRLTSDVTATEADAGLAATAKDNLAKSGAGSVAVVTAEAASGAGGRGPYDVIIIDGATEIEPQSLYEQLKMGGRLAGVFAQKLPPKACLVTRSPGDFGTRMLFDATAPVLPGLERVPAFSF